MNEKDNRTIKRIIGDNAEEAVVRMMLNDGYSLLCRNFEIHNVGELDCVFLKEQDVFIVEVRTRRHLGNYPSSSETVDYRKRRKIERTAQYLISRYNLYDRNIVFLVAQVTHDASGMLKNIELIPF